MSKPLTRWFKQQARHYCDCLNKIIWKIPAPAGVVYANQSEFIDLVDRIAVEATERLQMNGNPYAITWATTKEKFILYKPHPTPNHIKK